MASSDAGASNGNGSNNGGHHTKGAGMSCDSCRLRKVRCSREQPCAQCSHLDLPCRYTQLPRKRANPVRGRLIAQARDNNSGISNSNHNSGAGSSSAGASVSPQQQQGLLPPTSLPVNGHGGGGAGGSPGSGGAGFGAASFGAGNVNHRSPTAASGGSNGSSQYHYHYGAGNAGSPADGTEAGDATHWSPRTNHSIGGHDFQPDFFLNLLDDFEQVVFPFSPIITSAEITDIIRTNMSHDLEDEALIYSFAAVTTYLSNTQADQAHYPRDKKDHLNTLLQLGLRAYRQIDLGDPRALKDTIYSNGLSTTLKRIITCVFIEISMMAFKSYDRSFSLLREQVSMIQMIETNRRLQPRDVFPSVYNSPRYQRIYWEVFIHERFLSIAVGYPSILPPLVIGLPTADPAIPVYVDVSFGRLIHLFLILDEDFLAHWHAMQQQQNGTTTMSAPYYGRGKGPPMLTPQWIEAKQLELDDDEHQAAQAEAELSVRMTGSPATTHSSLSLSPSLATMNHHQHHHNIHHPNTSAPSSGNPRDEAIRALQHIDQYVTRLWMRTLLWQLALSRGLLSSDPSPHSHEGLSLHFPARRISTQLRSLVNRLDSFAAINTQGTGVLQKLFEVTSTIADVMALPSPAGPSVGQHAPNSSMMDVDMTSRQGPTAASPAGGPQTPHTDDGRGQEGRTDEDDPAMRMRDFVTLVRFLLRFDRVRPEQREYLEEKLRSLDSLYYGNGAGMNDAYAGVQQQQQQGYERRGY